MKNKFIAFLAVLTLTILDASSKLIVPLKRVSAKRSNTPSWSDQKLNNHNLTNFMINKGISSYLDIQYFIELYFGSSQSPFRLLVDTGSSWIWIPGEGFFTDYEHLRYYSCVEEDGCKNRNEEKEFFYGKGYILGELVNGKICINNESCFDNQLYVVAMFQYDLDGLRGDGLLGLGASGLMENQTTFLENLHQAGVIEEYSFSLYMDGQDDETSALVFGGFDSKYMLDENFTFSNITDDQYWAVNISGLSLGDKKIGLEVHKTVIDSGSSCIHLSEYEHGQTIDELMKIGDLIAPGKLQLESGFLFFMPGDFDLNAFPSLIFEIGGTNFTVDPIDYIIEIEGICLIMIDKTPVDGLNIIGDAFMHKYYTYFDLQNNRIGFARNVPRKDLLLSGLQILAISTILGLIFFCLNLRKNNFISNYICNFYVKLKD